MQITELFRKEIQDEVTKQLTDILVKKTGDFPQESYDLVNKLYVDTGGLSEGSGIVSVSSGTYTKLTPTNTFANNITWDSTNNKFVAKIPGNYIVAAYIGWAANASIQVQTLIYKNGSAIKIFQTAAPSSTAGVTSGGISFVTLKTGDSVQMYAYQASGGSVGVYNTSSSTWFQIAMI